jgi:hypothetical protein
MNGQKLCFVICPIGEENTPTRKRSDQIFKHIIEPVVTENGYRCLRADHIPNPGLITSHVIEYLMSSDLVIADLSGHNPNVFYELAIRHAVQKPVIQLIESNESIPFDIAGLRTIYVVTKEFDLDSIDKVKKEIDQQIKAMEEQDRVANPIFDALRIKLSRGSDDVEQFTLGDIYEEMQNLKSEFKKIIDIVKTEEMSSYATSGTEINLDLWKPEQSIGSTDFGLVSLVHKNNIDMVKNTIEREGGEISYRKLISLVVDQYKLPKIVLKDCLESMRRENIVTWHGERLLPERNIILLKSKE